MADIEKLVGSESRLEVGQKINEIIDSLAQGLPVGTVFPHTCSASFVPENSLPCNGSEYTQTQFPNLYSEWLITGKLKTCTYTQYTNMLTTYGQCPMWALDTTNKKFKVPTIKDGAVVQQAKSDSEIGKAYNAGLPNITGTLQVDGNNPSWLTGAFQQTDTTGNGPSGGSKDHLATFDASRSNAIYGKSDTVQMNAVALRYFVVVATKSVNASVMDWSNWASSLNSKLETSLSNISTTAKSLIMSWGMPDYSTVITVALGVTFTAPSNGLLMWNNSAKANVTVNGSTLGLGGNDNYNEGPMILPLSKGDNATFSADAGTPCFVSFKGGY